MHSPEEWSWGRSDLQQEIEIENVADYRTNRPRGTFCIIIRHPDVSSSFSIGPFDIPGSPPGILEAIGQALPELLRHLEIGIPEAGRATLSSPDFWSAVYSQELVESSLVRDRTDRR